MSVMSEGLTSAASESTMRLISGSVTATRELSAIKGCDLSTRATYLRVYTVSEILSCSPLTVKLDMVTNTHLWSLRQHSSLWLGFVRCSTSHTWSSWGRSCRCRRRRSRDTCSASSRCPPSRCTGPAGSASRSRRTAGRWPCSRTRTLVLAGDTRRTGAASTQANNTGWLNRDESN